MRIDNDGGLPLPIDQQPWYVVDIQGPLERADGCGPDCPPEQRHQRVEGLAQPVAAWLRAQADLLDPPRRPTRGELASRLRGSGLEVLPPPMP